jgi:hypothetical protein
MKLLSKIFGDDDREIGKYLPLVDEINAFEPDVDQPYPPGNGAGNQYYQPWWRQWPAIQQNHGIVW